MPCASTAVAARQNHFVGLVGLRARHLDGRRWIRSRRSQPNFPLFAAGRHIEDEGAPILRRNNGEDEPAPVGMVARLHLPYDASKFAVSKQMFARSRGARFDDHGDLCPSCVPLKELHLNVCRNMHLHERQCQLEDSRRDFI
jgi:hypothetical protein